MSASVTLSDALVDTVLAPTTCRWTETDATFALIANWWAVKDLRATLDLGPLNVVDVRFQTLHGDVVSLGSATATLAGC